MRIAKRQGGLGLRLRFSLPLRNGAHQWNDTRFWLLPRDICGAARQARLYSTGDILQHIVSAKTIHFIGVDTLIREWVTLAPS